MKSKLDGMRRKDREMSVEFGKQIIDKARFGVLSIVDGDKQVPYGISLSIVRYKDKLYFHTAKAGKKVELKTNNTNVSVVFVGDI